MMASERHIALEGGSNLRDIGGYETVDGRRVRWNIIFRSGALSRLSAADWQWMSERDIGVVCDLRSGEERALAPTEWQGGDRTRHVGIAYEAELIFGPLARLRDPTNVGEMGNSLYPLFPRLLASSFRMMFEALLDGHAPLIVHCSAGQDRTGLAIGLLLTALGVPRNVILADYLLSTGLRRVENEIDRRALAGLADSNVVAGFYAQLLKRRGDDAFRPRALLNRQGEPLLLDAFTAIEAEWGSIDKYLDQELGIGADALNRLRDMVLEPGEQAVR
jgi:protein-tyrosine phosphatase